MVKSNSLIISAMILLALSSIASLIALNLISSNLALMRSISKMLKVNEVPLAILVDHSINATWIYNYGDKEIVVKDIKPETYKLIEVPLMKPTNIIKPKTPYIINTTKFTLIVKIDGLGVVKVED